MVVDSCQLHRMPHIEPTVLGSKLRDRLSLKDVVQRPVSWHDSV